MTCLSAKVEQKAQVDKIIEIILLHWLLGDIDIQFSLPTSILS